MALPVELDPDGERIETPADWLNAMMLPAPGAVPPIVLLVPGSMMMPAPTLARAAAPVLSVPIQFPSMRLPDGTADLLSITIPLALPEIRLMAPGVVPPIVLPGALRWMPPHVPIVAKPCPLRSDAVP